MSYRNIKHTYPYLSVLLYFYILFSYFLTTSLIIFIIIIWQLLFYVLTKIIRYVWMNFLHPRQEFKPVNKKNFLFLNIISYIWISGIRLGMDWFFRISSFFFGFWNCALCRYYKFSGGIWIWSFQIRVGSVFMCRNKTMNKKLYILKYH